MGAVGDAFEMALTAHAGQTDKLGEPYVAHLVRVAARCACDTERAVALLHDIVEDCGVPLARIEAAFGVLVAGAVDAMTKRDGEEYEVYLARLAENPIARAVKMADLADNADPARLNRLDSRTRTRLEAKYATARAALGS